MAIPLSIRESFGCMSSDEVRPKYEALRGASRRTRRAVALVNDADQRLGQGFETHEDRPVNHSKRIVVGVLFVAISVPVFVWMYGVGMRDLGVMMLAAVLATAIVNLLPALLCRHTIADFVASRVFGVPVHPRHYIKQGLQKGTVRQM